MVDGTGVDGVLVVLLVVEEPRQELQHVQILVHHAEDLVVQVLQLKHNLVTLNHAVHQ